VRSSTTLHLGIVERAFLPLVPIPRKDRQALDMMLR
jgi:hypothetical protein